MGDETTVKVIAWGNAIESKMDLCPSDVAWDGETLVKPSEDGIYPWPMPGTTKVLEVRSPVVS